MTVASSNESVFVEKGHIYFFYRPKVMKEHVESEQDVQRIYMILKPIQQTESTTNQSLKSRLILIPKKKLPSAREHDKFYGFVWKTANDIGKLTMNLESEEYDTITRGHRKIESARPCGEGVYGIVQHHGHTHLAYVLEIPELPGLVQDAFHIEKQGSFIISIKNPAIASSAYPGIKTKAKYPDALQDQFLGRHFIPMNTSEYLDYEGCEIILIGASDDLARISNQADQVLHEWEQEESIEFSILKDTKVFDDLHLDKKKFIVGALYGNWE